MKEPIIIIAGPTASGKTNLAVKLAQKFNGEIINADSRSIYRKMNLATSKPTDEERQNIPHHLFDIVSPDKNFTTADYQKLAKLKITEIQNRGHLPFLVGGTGLYLDAVAYNFNLTKTKSDETLRSNLTNLSNEKLREELRKVDPESADKIDQQNRRRLIRALEVSLLTGLPFSGQIKKDRLPKNILYLAIDIPREILYEKINKRVDTWFSSGLIAETKSLMNQYSTSLPSMSSIGYIEIIAYLKGDITANDAAETMKKRSRNYAKRQLTWFRKNQDIIWITGYQDADSKIKEFLKKNT